MSMVAQSIGELESEASRIAGVAGDADAHVHGSTSQPASTAAIASAAVHRLAAMAGQLEKIAGER